MPADASRADPALTVGFVGIGNMGWPMATNLVRAGFQVAVAGAVSGRAARFAAESAAGPATARAGRRRRRRAGHQLAGGGGIGFTVRHRPGLAG